jgi:hypothetical protein
MTIRIFMSYSWVIFEDMIYTRVIPVLDRFVAVRYIIIAYPSGGRTCSILHCTIFFQTFH